MDEKKATPRRRWWRWGLLAALPLLVFAPMPPASVMYKSVLATERFGRHFCDATGCHSPELVSEKDVEGRVEKSFAIHRGQLFLRFQRTWASSLLVTWVDFDEWTPERVEELRRAHSELETYWPEPGLKDGGLRWVGQK
jgi:hypothetical protein